MKKAFLCLCLAGSVLPSAHSLTIVVDYTYDTNNFFSTPERRGAMQAVADRFSSIISEPLLAIDGNYMGGSTDWRIGFTHPGTGASFEISTAPNQASDLLVGIGASPANLYNSAFVLPANTWILYAGGRAGLGSAGVGGTGTGTNITSVFDDANGPMHRGAIPNTPANTANDLPVWGGAISFESTANWHFSLATLAPAGTTDFYSIALHEVGHALGLSTNWNQWKAAGGQYTGAAAVAAYNADNGTALTTLNLVSATDDHWQDGAYDSFIFTLGNPNLVGTVGLAFRQDLLMEPIANFGSPLPRRFELTNVDVAALRDLEWAIVPEPSAALLFFAGTSALGFARGRRTRI